MSSRLTKFAVLLTLMAASAVNVTHALGLWLEAEGNDFRRFYEGTASAVSGGSLYAPNAFTRVELAGATMELVNLNVPPFHLLLLPSLFVGPVWAGWAWQVLAHLVLVGVCFRIGALLGFGVEGSVATLALVLGSHPWWAQTTTGQVGGLLLLLSWGAWEGIRREHWLLAGSFLALIAAMKPPLSLLFCWTAFRHPRAIGGCVVPLLWFAAGTAYFGPGAWEEWFAAIGQLDWQWLWMNGSVAGFVNRLFVPGPTHQPLLDLPALAPWALWLFNSFVMIVTFLSLRSFCRLSQQLLLVGLCCQLTSPLGWAYYLPCLLPFALEWGASGAGRRTWLGWFLIPLWVVGFTELTSPWRPLLGSVCFGATFGAWSLMVCRARSHQA